MDINIEKIRADTPGVEEVVHLNSAGASLVTRQVADSVQQYLDEELLIGGYEATAKFDMELNQFYVKTAEWLNAHSEEIAYMDSATTAWQRAFFSINWQSGDELITSIAEYASNYISYLRLKKWFDIEIKVADDTEKGEIDPESVRKLINSKTRLISITHMPTLSGLVNPVEEIGKIAREKGVLYLVDACQSVGQYPLDVQKIQCDFLSGTGRKFMRGPRGTGFLYVRKEILQETEPLSLDLYSSRWMNMESYKMRKDAKRFEQFESNMALKIGLTKAIEYQMELGMENIWKRVQHLSKYLRDQIYEMNHAHVIDTGSVKSGIVCMDIPGRDVFEVMHELSSKNINTTAGNIFNSRSYMEKYHHEQALRASVHYYNTEEEIDLFVTELKKIIG